MLSRSQFIVVCLLLMQAGFSAAVLGSDNIQAAETKTVSTAAQAIAVDKPFQKLADVKKIFVAPFSSGEGAEMIRQKIINRLIKSGVISVTNSVDNADATLTGGAEISHRISFYMNPYCGTCGGGTRYHAQGAVHLIGKNDQTLWTAEKSSRFSFGSVSSTVARRIADSLVEAIEKDRAQIVATQETHL